jgi:6-phospho-3-hexuloisomerase
VTSQSDLEAILAEQKAIFAAIPADSVETLAEAIASAGQVFLYGVGRNGLVLQAFAMRLMHLGIAAHFVGQLSAPPTGPGDLLIAAKALGTLPTADAICDAARQAGARVAVFTARPALVADADLVIEIAAQTMADPPTSPLPLGSAFELGLYLLTELVILALMRRLGADAASLRARHANLL